jgi:hypothetical protein
MIFNKLKTNSLLPIAIAATIFVAPSFAKYVRYEPEIDTIVGVIQRQTFPGPPNYESIKNGDEAERYWILNLDEPVSIKGIDEIDIDEKDAKRVQLILTSEQYNKYRKWMLKRVRVIGLFTHAITGHHKTSLLIKANDIQLIQKRNSRNSLE